MAKDNERKLAKQLFLDGKSQKEIANIVNVQEKTIGAWVGKYGWKAERDARLQSSKNQLINIKTIISDLAEQRIKLMIEYKAAKGVGDDTKTEELSKTIAGVDNSAAYWNKVLANIDKENKISLSIYIEIMESIFKGLQLFDEKLYLKTMDFQEEHLSYISNKF